MYSPGKRFGEDSKAREKLLPSLTDFLTPVNIDFIVADCGWLVMRPSALSSGIPEEIRVESCRVKKAMS